MKRPTRSNVAVALVVCALAASLSSTTSAETKPMVYSALGAEEENTARTAEQAFRQRYTVAPVSAKEQFVPAKVTKRTLPPYIRYVGRVTVAYVAAVDGVARDPVVVESTNPRLNIMLRETVKNWRCVPARLNGAPVPTLMKNTIQIRWRKPAAIF